MSGAVERSDSLSPGKDLAEGAGKTVPLSQNGNFRQRPHSFGHDYMLGRVYFITDGNRIKIGYSGAPSLRIKDLQTGSPLPLRMLGSVPGTPDDEKRTHGLFHHIRLEGEWFQSTPELLAYADGVCGGTVPFGPGQVHPTQIEQLRADLKAWAAKQDAKVVRYLPASLDACLAALAKGSSSTDLKWSAYITAKSLEAAVKGEPPPADLLAMLT